MAAVSSRSRGGFSLLELLAVLAIVVAGASLILPSLVRVEDRTNLEAESKRLGRLFRVAQSRAISTRSDVTLQADLASDHLTIVEAGLVERISVDLATVNPPGDLVFSPDGGPSSEKAYTLLGADGDSRIVTVGAGTGHITYGP